MTARLTFRRIACALLALESISSLCSAAAAEAALLLTNLLVAAMLYHRS
jgi:hypothetical protein